MHKWTHNISKVLKKTDRSLLKLNRSDASLSSSTPRHSSSVSILNDLSWSSKVTTARAHPEEHSRESAAPLQRELHALHKRLAAVESRQSETQALKTQLERALDAVRSVKLQDGVKLDNKLRDFSTRHELRAVHEQVRTSWQHDLNQVELQVKALQSSSNSLEAELRQQLEQRLATVSQQVVTIDDLKKAYERISNDTNARIETFSQCIQEAIDSVTQTSYELHESVSSRLAAFEASNNQFLSYLDRLNGQVRQLERSAASSQRKKQRDLLERVKTELGTELASSLRQDLSCQLAASLQNNLQESITVSVRQTLAQQPDLQTQLGELEKAQQSVVDKLGELEQRVNVVESNAPFIQLGSFHSTDQANITFGEEEVLSDLHKEILTDESQFNTLVQSIAEEFLNRELAIGSQRVREVTRRTRLK